MRHTDLLDALQIVAQDIAAELTMEQRLRLARLIRQRAFIEADDEIEALNVIATAFECYGLSMDTNGEEGL